MAKSQDMKRKKGRAMALEELKQLLKSEMPEDMEEKLHGLKKVVVASPSEEGLEEGLDKAQMLLKMKREEEMDEDEDEEEKLADKLMRLKREELE